MLQKFLGNGKGAVVNNRLVMVFKHDMLAFVKRHIVSVYLFPLEFVLTQCADIEIVAENFGDGHDAPCFLYLALVLVALRFLAGFFPHSRRGDMLVCQMVCNLFVAPAVDIVGEYPPHYLGGRLVNLKGHFLGVGDDIAERHRTYPLAL